MQYIKSPDDLRSNHISCGLFCITKSFNELSDRFLKAYVAYNQITHSVSVKNSSSCVNEIFNSQYKKSLDKLIKAKENEETSYMLYIILGGIALLVILVVGLLVIICRRKCGGNNASERETLNVSNNDNEIKEYTV